MIVALSCFVFALTQKQEAGVSGYVGRLPSGSIVRVLAVEDSAQSFWAPDGGVLDLKLRDKLTKDRLPSKAQGASTGRVIHFEIEPKNSKLDLGLDGKCSNVSGVGFYQWRFWKVRDKETEPYQRFGYLYIAEPNASEAEVSIGLAEGRFEVVAKSVRKGESFLSVLGPKHQVAVRQIEPYVYESGSGQRKSPQFKLEGTLPNLNTEDHETRLIIFKKNGKPVEDGGGSSGNGTVDMTYGGLAKDIERVELQSRPYAWVRFTGIRLKPNIAN